MRITINGKVAVVADLRNEASEMLSEYLRRPVVAVEVDPGHCTGDDVLYRAANQGRAWIAED
jgi:hypothetical protein